MAEIRHELERDSLPALGIDIHVGEALRGFSPVLRETDNEVEDLLSLIDLRDRLSSEERCEFSVEIAGGHSIGQGAGSIEFDAQMGNRGLLFAVSLLEARNLSRNVPDLIADPAILEIGGRAGPIAGIEHR